MVVSSGHRVHGRLHDHSLVQDRDGSQKGGAIPSSPTVTNPDMILPDENNEQEGWAPASSSPSVSGLHPPRVDQQQRTEVPLHRNFSRRLSPSSSESASNRQSCRLSDIGEEEGASRTLQQGDEGNGGHTQSQAEFVGEQQQHGNGTSSGGEEVPSAVLSSEAERILENAKKRLSVC